MGSVQIENVVKRFGAVEALKSVSVEIAAGEFVALVGPSGCGKSTLLRLIAGLDDITSGDIRIGGRLVNELTPQERDLAMVFQNYALYPHMTVAANMGFSLKMRGAAPREIEAAVARAAGILGLDQLLSRYPGQLSGGQRQRVAMGRAIVRDCEVFLFDEPLSNLDAQLRVQMRSEIKGLHQKLGNTMVYVTHDQIEAMTMADRIVVMRDGIVEQMGAPIELYDTPANTFVACFIGSPGMNMIEGRIANGGAGEVTLASGRALAVAGLPAAAEGRAVTVGIRPEDLALAPGGFPARVTMVEPTGSDTHLVLDADGLTLICSSRSRPDVSPGSEVALAVDPSRVHLFDGATGARLSASAA
jgi:multiple sugar transport system ATP-binding protein